MLSSLLKTHPTQLDALAEAWLAANASAFALCSDGEVLANWPRGCPMGAPDAVAPIYAVDGKRLGELCVAGVADPAAIRLGVDAVLVGALVDACDALDSVVEALAETEDQLIALYELIPPGTSRLNVDQILSSTARQATRLVKAAGAFVVLGPTQSVQCPEALVSTATLTTLWQQLQACGHELLLVAGDVSSDVADNWPVRADHLFLAPLCTDEHGVLVACLGLWLRRPAATLSPDLKLARSIAEQAGAQLEIALLHQKLVAQAKLEAELDLARRVQLGLLPRRPPQIAGLELFAESRPALQVGGDFYDFFMNLADSNPLLRFTFAVGDVSGKGISAALLMAMTRTALRVVTSSMTEARTPEEILRRANADLYDDFSEVGMLASVFVGQYDVEQRVLTYANDGHSPVIFRPKIGAAYLLEADGPMMGVLPVNLAQNQSVPFGSGDVLAVLTDGFNEAINCSGEFFGLERLHTLIDEMAELPAAEIGRRLFAAIDQFSAGRAQDDDQTVIIVKGI